MFVGPKTAGWMKIGPIPLGTEVAQVGLGPGYVELELHASVNPSHTSCVRWGPSPRERSTAAPTFRPTSPISAAKQWALVLWNATRVPGHPKTRVNPPIFKPVNPRVCVRAKTRVFRVWRKYLITIKIIKFLTIVYSNSLTAWQIIPGRQQRVRRCPL